MDYWSGRGDIFKHAHNNKNFSSRQADDLALHRVSESVHRLSMHNPAYVDTV